MSLLSRFLSVFRSEQLDQELKEEQEFHIACRTEELMTDGLSEDAAERQALREFGNRCRNHLESRDAKLLLWLESSIHDVRYGARTLLKSPSFAGIAILTLALGIGANTAMFSLVNSVLLNPLPYEDPSRLIALFERIPSSAKSSISYPNLIDWRDMNHSFTTVAGYRSINANVVRNGQAEHVQGETVSAGFFQTLGIRTVRGRTFSSKDGHVGSPATMMISETLWKTRFDAVPNIIGQTLVVDGTPRTIIGIIPSRFHFPLATSNNDIYTPLGNANNPELYTNRGEACAWMAVARLKPGVSLAAAKADMEAVSRELATTYPAADENMRATLFPLRNVLIGDLRLPLLVLQGAVFFVLLISSVNVANLLLARSISREREFAVRLAVGAGNIRLVRQLLTESVLLALVGASVGLLIAKLGLRTALSMVPHTVIRPDDVRLNWPVLLFTFSISFIAGIFFGIAPAFKTRVLEIGSALKETGRGVTAGRHRSRGLFVSIEIAMAFVLLVGAGLMLRTLFSLWHLDPGFNPHGLTTMSVSPSPSVAKRTPEAVRSFLRQLHEAVASLPDVSSVSLGGYASPMNGDQEWYFWLFGKPKPLHTNELPTALVYIIEPGYRDALQLRLIMGRFLSPSDTESAGKVVVIDDTMANRYFPGRNPIGQYLDLDTDPQNPGRIPNPQIVGVVGHVNQWGLASDASSPLQAEMYLPIAQIPDKEIAGFAQELRMYVRTTSGCPVGFDALRRQLSSVDRGLVVYDDEPMDVIVSRSIASKRFTAALLVVFAAIALFLASIGIYGVLSHLVGQRRQEIGIRMAMGATPSDVLRMILADGGRLVLIGLGMGVIAALGLTHLISGLLYGVRPTDLPTFAFVLLILASVSLAGCCAPARSAMKVDPMISLRNQ